MAEMGGAPRREFVLDTNTLRSEERKEKFAIKQAKADAKLAKADAKLAKVAAKDLKIRIQLERANRNVSLAAAGYKRGWFGRVVKVRQSKVGHVEHLRHT